MSIKNQLKDNVVVYGEEISFDIPCGESEGTPVGFTSWSVEVFFTEEKEGEGSLIPDINTTESRVVLTAQGRIQFTLTNDEVKLLVDSKNIPLSTVFMGIWRKDLEQALGLYQIPMIRVPVPE